jgi:hypothetical protein
MQGQKFTPRTEICPRVWDAININTGGNVLTSHAWLNLADTFGMKDHSFGLFEGQNLIGILGIWSTNIFGFRRGVSIPFGFGNIRLLEEDEEARTSKFLAKKVNMIRINSPRVLNLNAKTSFTTGTEIVVNTRKNSDEWTDKLHHRIRKYIRSSESNELVEVRAARNLFEVEECWNIYKKSMKQAGSPGSIPLSFFIALYKSDISTVFMLGIYSGKIVTYLNLVAGYQSAFAISTGVDRELINNSITPLVMKRSTDWARDLGVENIHFWGGLDGKEDGIFAFKKKYGDSSPYFNYVRNFDLLGQVASRIELVLTGNFKRRIRWLINFGKQKVSQYNDRLQ